MSDIDDFSNCEVCGNKVLYGSRHHQCGTFALAKENELDCLRAEVARLKEQNSAMTLASAHLINQLAAANENVRLMAEQSLKYQEAAHAANGRVERMWEALVSLKTEFSTRAGGTVVFTREKRKAIIDTALYDLYEVDKEKS